MAAICIIFLLPCWCRIYMPACTHTDTGTQTDRHTTEQRTIHPPNPRPYHLPCFHAVLNACIHMYVYITYIHTYTLTHTTEQRTIHPPNPRPRHLPCFHALLNACINMYVHIHTYNLKPHYPSTKSASSSSAMLPCTFSTSSSSKSS